MKAFFIRTNERWSFFILEDCWGVEGGDWGGVPAGNSTVCLQMRLTRP